ncbi:MAG TPA: sodium:solute symporter [Gemmatimonadales bacterium]|nr:sodium:solute symporter [Gemmatimonadales bacterium]
MSPLDLLVIALYFAGTLGVGLWLSRQQRSAQDYFLGARDLPAWTVLLSIVATETSALTVISVPGIGARGDLTFLQLPLGYLFGRIGVALWLLPGYFTGKQDTAYARLEARFGVSTRRLLSLVFLVTRFLGDGVRVFAGAIPLALLTGWSVPTAILAMGVITLIYTWMGGIKAVIWADIIQLAVYVTGGVVALGIAIHLSGGLDTAMSAANAAGKLRIFDWHLSLTAPYTFLGGIIGGALLSAASHGTDQLIVQRLLATRSLRDARVAIIGSGVVVVLQFALFLLIGVALWTAHLAPADAPADHLFGQFILQHLPTGVAGLMIAGILAAAMSSHASAINAMASSLTYDQYASWTGEQNPTVLLKVGRIVSLIWGVALMVAALGFNALTSTTDTPVVVLALSIASVTYGALLGAYILAGLGVRIEGRDVIRAAMLTMAIMLVTVFAARLAAWWPALTGLGRVAWPWYVPMGTALMVGMGWLSSRLRPAREVAA